MDLIDRQDAIVALRNVWNALWEIDIPSPTVPEYIEHHEQVQGIMKMVQDMIDTLPCTESQRESVQDVPDINVGDMVSRSYLLSEYDRQHEGPPGGARKIIEEAPSAWPERLTDDDFETIRIHLNAFKEKLCNQHRWEEAEEYQRIIDRFMAFASAEPERKTGNWIYLGDGYKCPWSCSNCSSCSDERTDYCPMCGTKMVEDGRKEMKNTIPVLPPRAMDMIRELCFMSALGIDQIAKETGLHGYQEQLAKLYITVFEEVLDAEEESK